MNHPETEEVQADGRIRRWARIPEPGGRALRVVLLQDKETVHNAFFDRALLRAGECATFPKGTGNGHHLINESSAIAIYLEVDSRNLDDLTTCSDVDMKSANSDGLFVRKNGTPYAESGR